MELSSGFPFFLAKNGLIRTYGPIQQAECCDVVVVGGGITGAILSYSLQQAGFSTLVLDRRNFGWGSTSATTALIQYEIDTHLADLCDMIGPRNAATAYAACRDAVWRLRDLCAEVGSGSFTEKDSVYFASTEREVEPLRREFELRQNHGLPVEWMTEADFAREFDFSAPAAIRSQVAGELDAFELAHALLDRAVQLGAKAFARTEVTRIDASSNGVTLHTNRGPAVRCRWAVVASGYESLPFLIHPLDVRLHNTFAFATEPMVEMAGWPNGCLLWETSRPYLYARTTADGRAIVGGEDIPFKSPFLRERLLPRKIARLEKRFRELFPRIPLELCVRWAGTFAETPDGLPYIGFPPEQPGTFFALAYGGNGISYSMIAAEMLLAELHGQSHPCASIFRFGRN